MHELDTGKPTDNPETSVFQGVVFDKTEDAVRTALKTAGGVVDGDVYVLQLLGENTSVPAKSLLHLNTTEILDGASSNYILPPFANSAYVNQAASALTPTPPFSQSVRYKIPAFFKYPTPS